MHKFLYTREVVRKKKSGSTVVEVSHDEIGFWSELKLDILQKYWPAYTTVVKSQPYRFHTVYIDAFAGSGLHKSRTTGELIKGSPSRALEVEPAFDEYHFVDLAEQKIRSLEAIAAERTNVHVHHGDCNKLLLQTILPCAKYEDYRRAVCLLDPYSLQLDWNVIAEAGAMKSVEVFINFPIMDINRNVLRRDASATKIAQMDQFWGDRSWRDVAYRSEPTLFGDLHEVKLENWAIADAFRERLRTAGNFKYVPEAMAMRNSMHATVYYLVFAGNNETGANIVRDIFNDYREKGYG